MKSYELPADLLQAIIETLQDLPARQSRGMLNHIEALISKQDAAGAPSVGAASAPRQAGGDAASEA